jgi:Fe-S-cluster containining protein
MMLSNADVERLEEAGYYRRNFERRDEQGFIHLQNYNGHCVFYVSEELGCRVYKDRPLGCQIYPVILKRGEGIGIDDLCPMENTVSKRELKRKGEELVKHLKRLYGEAQACPPVS